MLCEVGTHASQCMISGVSHCQASHYHPRPGCGAPWAATCGYIKPSGSGPDNQVSSRSIDVSGGRPSICHPQLFDFWVT